MTWLNPWAWLGLLTVAVPILVHLLARQSARVQRFPTLRFLATSRLVTARRARPTDLLLLALRIAILAVAVAALAQPFLTAGDSDGRDADLVARAIVVDTSASMQRASAGGTALVAAWADARSAVGADSAGQAASITVETAALDVGVAGAAAWLESRPGRRELIVISDFQRGAIDSLDLAAVPAATGIDLRRVPIDGETTAGITATSLTAISAATTPVRVTVSADSTRATWTRAATDAVDDAAPSIGTASTAGAANAATAALVLHAAADSTTARAIVTAVVAAGAVPDTARPIALVMPGYDGAGGLDAQPLTTAWMGDVAVAVHRDPLLAAVAAAALSEGPEPAVMDSAAGSAWVPLLRRNDGSAAVSAARATVGSTDRLVLRLEGSPPPVLSAAVLAAAISAGSAGTTSFAELEPVAIGDEVLDGWRRPAASPDDPAARAATLTPDSSHGRWLWLVVLVLLGVETWLRRRARAPEREAP